MNIHTQPNGKMLVAPSGHKSTVIIYWETGHYSIFHEDNSTIREQVAGPTTKRLLDTALPSIIAELERQ